MVTCCSAYRPCAHASHTCHRCWLSAIHCCQPSVTELLCLEWCSAACHVSTITGRLPQSPQDPSLQALLPITLLLSCHAREVTCHYGHVNHFRYLLSYLIHVAVHWPWPSANQSLSYSQQVSTQQDASVTEITCSSFLRTWTTFWRYGSWEMEKITKIQT